MICGLVKKLQPHFSNCIVEVNLEYRYDTENLRTKSGHGMNNIL